MLHFHEIECFRCLYWHEEKNKVHKAYVTCFFTSDLFFQRKYMIQIIDKTVSQVDIIDDLPCLKQDKFVFCILQS